MWKRSSSLLTAGLGPAACLALALTVGLLPGWAAAPTQAKDQPVSPATLTETLTHARTAAGPGASRELAPKQEETCFIQSIACGQTVSSNLATTDCQTENGFYVDFWEFTGQSGQTVTARLNSNAFDAFLVLLDPTPEVVADDDDGGPGTNSRLVHTLDQTSNRWALAATTFAPSSTGPYTLSLECSGGGPPPPPQPPPGFFGDPQYPDFWFDVTITPPGQAPIDGTRESDCLPDTVCVSGAVPGRTETYVRILGPRPNGFLWPTLIRFTPSAVRLEIRQISTGESRVYMLPAVVGGDLTDLSGVQDRMGFSP